MGYTDMWSFCGCSPGIDTFHIRSHSPFFASFYHLRFKVAIQEHRFGGATCRLGIRKNTRPSRGNNSGNDNASPPPTPYSISSDSFSTLSNPRPGTNVSTSEYARRCKALMELQRDLNALGANMFSDLKFPRITVIGGQSAGKSSLIEAVSGISVPRDSGTCTRCPMEVAMSSSASKWSCNISLRISYDAQGNELGASETLPFGTTITNKRDVEIWLRRAQAAILSPHRSTEEFYKYSRAEMQQLTKTDTQMLQFSQNVVQVDLKDPDATDLSFIDLPGLIQNADQNLIDLVKKLAEDHIEGENTLILVTVPMSDDLENQQAVLLAKNKDPAGKRTIVILTKPDALTAGATGARQKWRDIIMGQEHQLTHGHYCVRLPDDAERSKGMSRADSQKLADEFFATTSPWSDILHSNRFGIPNFVSNVSKLLVELIEANLPTLRENLKKLLADYHLQLKALPPLPTGNPMAEVLNKVRILGEAVQRAVNGDTPDYKRLVQTNRVHYEDFMKSIRYTCPDFRPFEAFNSQYGSTLRAIDDIHQTMVEIDIEWHTGVEIPKGDIIHLDDVRKIIKDQITWELTGHVPFEATKVMVRQITEKWPTPSLNCFEEVFTTTSGFVKQMVVAQFGQFKKLEVIVLNVVRDELQKCRDEALDALCKLLELESVPLYTQNGHYLQDCRAKWLRRYTRELENAPRDIERWYNSYIDELKVMADVRAYFQVAYKRIIDYVPLMIEHQLNQKFADRLPEALIKTLMGDKNSSDLTQRMKDLVSEDPEIATKRKFLLDRITRLEEIRERLNRV